LGRLLVIERPELLFVSPRFLFPADTGGAIRTSEILRGLKGGAFRIRLMSPATADEERRYAAQLAEIADDWQCWPTAPKRSTLSVRRIPLLASSLPVPIASDRSTQARAMVAAALARKPSVAIFDFLHSVVLAPDSLPVPSVLFTHNVEAEIFARNLQYAKRVWGRLLWRDQLKKMRRFEAAALRRFDRVVAVSARDAGQFAADYGRSEVDVIPLQYAIASDVAVLLARLLEQPAQAGADAGRVSVLAEPSTNTLLVRATTPARANLVRVLAQKLDQPSAAPGNIHVVYLKNANAANLARTLLGIAPDQGTPLSGQPGFQSQIQTGSRPVGTAPARPLTGAAATPAAVSGQLAGAQIQADPATNTLIIIAPDAVYRSLRAVIDKLDTRRAQVFIESLIIEVTSDQAAEFGIQWQAGTSHLQGSGGAAGFAGTNFGTTGQNIIGISQNPATVGTGLSIGVARGQITLPGIGTVTNLQFLARALESMSKANILSTPNILTLDNEEARIIVGQNVPFVTGQYVTPASSGAATVNPFQTVERRDVGLTLRVRPQISESGTIKLVIYQEVSSVQDTSNPAGIITNMRAIETNVLVDDGSIVVLGGLVQDSVTSNTEKVPVLGDIPLIGQLFRFETRRQQKTNLMVFLRPFIVREDADVRGVTIDRYDAMRRMEEVTTPAPHPVLPEIKGPVAPAP